MGDIRCPLAWVHIATRTNGSTRLCCLSDIGNNLSETPRSRAIGFVDGSFADILNSDYRAYVRELMASGEWPSECGKCRADEALSGFSKRTNERAQWPSEVFDVPVVRELDLRFGNACNLACVSCSSVDSSSWSRLYPKLYGSVGNKTLANYLEQVHRPEGNAQNLWQSKPEEFWKNFKVAIPDLERIYFAGGEPLVQKEHSYCLDLLIASGRAGDIALRYNTNGTVLSDEIIAKWAQFKSINLLFSLDSYGEKNDYIRYGSRWSHIIENIKKVHQIENASLSITKTIQIYNIFYLSEFQSEISKMNLSRKIPVYFNYVHFPSFLSIQALPSEIKDDVEQKLLRSQVGGELPLLTSEVLKFMNEKDQSRVFPLFVDYTKSLDATRATSFARTFPEFHERISGFFEASSF